jgi:hypothetical protein
LLLVAKRMDARKTATITGTTTNGELMLILQLLVSLYKSSKPVDSGQRTEIRE